MKYSRLWCGSFSTSVFSFSQSCLCHNCLWVSKKAYIIFHCPWPAFPRACFSWDCFPPPSSPRGWALYHFRAQCPYPRHQTLKPFPRQQAPRQQTKAAGSFSKAADPEAFSKAAGFLEQLAPFRNFTLALKAMAFQKLSTLSTTSYLLLGQKNMHAGCEHACKA